jgi:hypothetical protein
VNAVEAQWGPRFGGRTDWFVAGDVDPTVMLICGYYRATFGSSAGLFAGLSTLIVDRSEPTHHDEPAPRGFVMADSARCYWADCCLEPHFHSSPRRCCA